MKSAKVHLVKFLFLLPLIGAMLLAFRNKVSNQKDPETIHTKIDIIDTIPAPAKPARPAFPKNVASIVAKGNALTVTLKNGSKETYNLDKPEQREAFEKKYGHMPDFPEPPDPPKPAEPSEPAKPLDLEESKLPPAAASPPIPPVVQKIPANVSAIHINNEKATIKLKNGKVETYDLNKPDEKEAFEKKYGDFTPTPPVKPVAPSAPKVTPVASTLTVTGPEPVVAIDFPVPVTSVSTTLSADVIYVQPANHSISPGDKEETIVEITKQTTKEQIDELKRQLLSKGYTLSISSIKYLNGILHSIDAIISDEESKSRFLADDFSKIIITHVTYKDGKSGFYIRIMDGVIKL
jgi:competence protein ComGC